MKAPRARKPATTCNVDPRIDARHLAPVQDAVIGWFGAHGRDLPWRRTRDPWAVLVSEIMLQQIQVARALPFYAAFLARFPTVGDLAAAPLAEAIRVWGDLGRYRRVVNLHRTARIVVERHGGAIPSDVTLLRALPGIGPYTAGAIACFAFEQDVGCVDTNVRRVLHRIFVGVDVPNPTVPEGEVAQLAAAVVPPGRGWAWNQGVMDLGATVCTARAPRCGDCPVRAHCRAAPDLRAALAQENGRRRERPTYRYEESNRYYRGRVLARLREHSIGEDADAGLPLHDLGAQVRPGFSADHVPWLRSVVDSLAKDGLAVAEERPAYDAGYGGEATDPEVRVKLPG